MPPRRNKNINDVYEQEFEQRIMERMEERLDQFVDQLADRMNNMMNPRRRGDHNGRRNEGEEDTLNPEGFMDWLVAVEEVFEFKEVPENKRVSLIAIKLRVTLSYAYQRALCFEKQNRRVRVSSSAAITGCSSGLCNVASRFVPNQTRPGGGNTRPVSKDVRSSGLKCLLWQLAILAQALHLSLKCYYFGPWEYDRNTKHDGRANTYSFLFGDELEMGDEVHKVVHDNLVRANSKYKQDADQKRRHVDFEVGDFVWAILTKDRFLIGEYNKLSAKKIGQLEIVKKINSNAHF
nr:reverse transcriptase domain-containing protein [Tanacetum cinerariifolium]